MVQNFADSKVLLGLRIAFWKEACFPNGISFCILVKTLEEKSILQQ